VRHFSTLDIVPQADIRGEMRHMQDSALQHFAISVRTWFESHLNVRWIGRWGTEEGLPIQTKNTKLAEKQIRDISVSAFLEFLRKSFESVSSKSQKFVKHAVACVKTAVSGLKVLHKL
jgi:hypothetical protein